MNTISSYILSSSSSPNMMFIHESHVFELWIEKSEVLDPRTFPNDFYYCNLKNLLIINFLSYA